MRSKPGTQANRAAESDAEDRGEEEAKQGLKQRHFDMDEDQTRHCVLDDSLDDLDWRRQDELRHVKEPQASLPECEEDSQSHELRSLVAQHCSPAAPVSELRQSRPRRAVGALMS